MSLAIKEDNDEYIEAVKKGMVIIKRHELLGEILKNFRYSVAVSGTHGKTTVSAMIGYILRLAKLDPSIHIGSELFYEKHGTYFSGSDYFVMEACEYGNSFHNFSPFIGVILNIEADHLDFFKDTDDVIKGFSGFASGIQKNGHTVYFSGDHNAKKVSLTNAPGPVSYGFYENDDYMVRDIKTNGKKTSFSVFKKGSFLAAFSLYLPGRHNIINALCAVAVCDLLCADLHFIKQGIREFKGAARRLEYIGRTKDGIELYDDYAHHPTEIRASLEALVTQKKGRIICIYQPHTYTRTKALFNDFLTSFDNCDILVLVPIYAAREKNLVGISSDDICKALSDKKAVSVESFQEAVDYVKKIVRCDDLVVSMGAGDVYKTTYALKNESDHS
jgi:UDP-N-acetylmuramate--alanine ligase